jgi:methylglyoxal synthase
MSVHNSDGAKLLEKYGFTRVVPARELSREDIVSLVNSTSLEIETFMNGSMGGKEQIASRVSFNEIDIVFYFRSTSEERVATEDEISLLRLCDMYNVPVATNIATAEVLVTAIESGALNWRELINPRSEYNLRKRGY